MPPMGAFFIRGICDAFASTHQVKMIKRYFFIIYINYLYTMSFSNGQREREHFLEIFKIQVDDIILPGVADGVTMHWCVTMS